MRIDRGLFTLAAAIALVGALGPMAEAQPACPVKLGGILSLTGSLGAIGKPIADSARLAVEHVNAAGGVKGCPIEFILRDDQGQSTVGVDAAKNLVDVQGVPAIIGAISSGVSLPVLTSVAVPAKVTMVSCCSTAPTFTTLAQEGKTGGYFFRTLPTTKTQAYGAAKIAAERGYKKVAIIYVNTDFGVNLAKDFTRALQKLGGAVVLSIPYQENQPSYRAEVTRALAATPDSIYLVAFPQDGATLAREWISFGGTQNIILNNALRADQFLKAVGARFLQNAYGMDNAQVAGPSVDAFNQAYQAKFGSPPNGPGLHTVYDAVAVTALAMQAAKTLTGTEIRDNIRRVTGPTGTPVSTGVEGLRRGLELLRGGQAIRYTGATGPIQFDAYGDVSGPILVYRFKDEQIVTERVMTLDEVQALFKQIDG
ncbi:MAG TPA: ABC transporter substrate-binding protein [Methylomirabilota bacterium]|nr:ABC transporter substrate-binding protein [Methylomirabilota bacterium]